MSPRRADGRAPSFVTIRFLALISIFVGLSMIPSIVFAVLDQDVEGVGMLLTAFFAAFAGFLIDRGLPPGGEPSARDGYFMVTSGWLLAGVWGAIPYLLSGYAASPVDAFFESISGFTTTGSTIFRDVEALPRCILFWRSTTHWLGGMGIIVMAIAILPALGIGGYTLFAAEVPGLAVERLRPRIAATARLLWGVYALLTLAQTLLLWRFGSGMLLFDAVNHAFATLATGGFSTRNASLGAFSPLDQWITAVFLLLAGANFTLHYRALSGKPGEFLRNEEFRLYAGVVAAFTLVITVFLVSEGRGVEPALRAAFFQTVSLISTTGFVSEDYELWPPATFSLILIMLLLGGCSGSTSGGIKQERLLCLWKAGVNEVRRLLHPRGVFLLKIGRRVLPPETSAGVMGFFAIYIVSFLAGTVFLSMTGLDLLSAAGASAASLGNVGPGLGSVGAADNYAHLSASAKLVCSFLMLLGRLELMTVLVVFAALLRRPAGAWNLGRFSPGKTR